MANPIPGSLFQRFLVHGVRFVGNRLFSRVVELFPFPEKIIPIRYPTVIYANHVSELDIASLSYTYFRLRPNVRFIIPTREDILQSNFLFQEFRPKGFLRLILSLIDKSKVIPFMMKTIGAFPVKRPFRDNVRSLAKDNSLRDQVEAEWETLAKEVQRGKNFFLFPEGTFTKDGAPIPFKNGIKILADKIGKADFFPFSLTYDTLTAKRDLYLHYISPLRDLFPSDNLTKDLRKILAEGLVLTYGNIFSFFLLYKRPAEIFVPTFTKQVFNFWERARQVVRTGESWDFLTTEKRLVVFLTKLHSMTPNLIVKKDFHTIWILQESLYKYFAEPLRGKLHPVPYHRGQLTPWFDKLEAIAEMV